MSLMNIVLYALIIYMIIRIIMMNKIQKKNKQLIDIIQHVDEEDYFFEHCDALIASLEEKEYVAKVYVIKLWGICYHERWDEFEATLDEIILEDMIKESKNKVSIETNEDSFFYLYLAIPDMLYNASRQEERNLLREKMNFVHEKLDGQLCLAISEANDLYFEKKEDQGLAFYEKVLNGDYGEYWYSKSLIGLYKAMVGTMAATLYKEKGEEEKYQDVLPFVKEFYGTGIGKRWMKGLNIDTTALEEPEEEEDKEEVFEVETKEEEKEKAEDQSEQETESEEEK